MADFGNNQWYFGPVGDLLELPEPSPGVQVEPRRYGGVHQSLSGASTVDILGSRMAYGFELKFCEDADYERLFLAYSGDLPGPFRLLSPMRMNRLSPQSSVCRITESLGLGLRKPDNTTWSWDDTYPDPPYRARKVQWTGVPTLWFDYRVGVPVFPSEDITVSLDVLAGTSLTASIKIEWLDRDHDTVSTDSESVSVTTSWARVSEDFTAPAGAAVARVGLELPTGSGTYLALNRAMVCETGSASSWALGGGAPEVVIETLTSTSPIFPYHDVNVTFLET